MDARAARVHAALQLQHSLEALRADFDARFGDLAEKRATASDAPSQLRGSMRTARCAGCASATTRTPRTAARPASSSRRPDRT